MKKSTTEIKTKLKSIWPDLFNIWLQDKAFWLPSKERMDQFVQRIQNKLQNMQWRDQISDCDNYAIWLIGEATWIRASMYSNIPSNEWYSWAVFYCNANVVRGMDMYHSLNLCLCDDGIVYMIDPTDNCKVWPASRKYDSIYYVFGG